MRAADISLCAGLASLGFPSLVRSPQVAKSAFILASHPFVDRELNMEYILKQIWIYIDFMDFGQFWTDLSAFVWILHGFIWIGIDFV